MHRNIKPETQQRMRSLCREISVAHGLDDEIQEELYGHMEDKLLAYLNGEEPVMEEDALILVREHFGDPATVKDLMHDVHTFEAHGSLARRIGAALVATLAIEKVSHLAAGALIYFVTGSQEPLTKFWLMQGIGVGSQVLTITLLFLVLRHYQRVMDADGKPWFMTLRPAYFVGLALLLSFLPAWSPQTDASAVADVNPLTQAQTTAALVLLSILSAMECVVWLWWCDKPPRRRVAVGNVAGVWVLMSSIQLHWLLDANFVYQAFTSPDFLLSLLRDQAYGLGVSTMFAVLAIAIYVGALAAGRSRQKWAMPTID